MKTFRSMTRFRVTTIVLATVVATSTVGLSQAATIPRFKLVDLGARSGFGQSSASKINNAGAVVGVGYLVNGNSPPHPFLYDRGMMSDLSPVTGIGVANDINDNSIVVGFSIDVGTHPETLSAFLYQNGQSTNLRMLSGEPLIVATAINSSGAVAGYFDNNGQDLAFSYSGGEFRLLGTLPGGSISTADGINSIGEIVGSSSFRPNVQIAHAVVFSGGSVTDLGTFAGVGDVSTNLQSGALAINDNGDVVGWSVIPSFYYSHAFLYRHGVMTDLGTLAGDFWSGASDVNIWGQVVGTSQKDEFHSRAFLYSEGVIYDLKDLVPKSTGWTFASAAGINDSGQIVGTGYYNNSGPRAFLLDPIKKQRP